MNRSIVDDGCTHKLHDPQGMQFGGSRFGKATLPSPIVTFGPRGTVGQYLRYESVRLFSLSPLANVNSML